MRGCWFVLRAAPACVPQFCGTQRCCGSSSLLFYPMPHTHVHAPGGELSILDTTTETFKFQLQSLLTGVRAPSVHAHSHTMCLRGVPCLCSALWMLLVDTSRSISGWAAWTMCQVGVWKKNVGLCWGVFVFSALRPRAASTLVSLSLLSAVWMLLQVVAFVTSAADRVIVHAKLGIE